MPAAGPGPREADLGHWPDPREAALAKLWHSQCGKPPTLPAVARSVLAGPFPPLQNRLAGAAGGPWGQGAGGAATSSSAPPRLGARGPGQPWTCPSAPGVKGTREGRGPGGGAQSGGTQSGGAQSGGDRDALCGARPVARAAHYRPGGADPGCGARGQHVASNGCLQDRGPGSYQDSRDRGVTAPRAQGPRGRRAAPPRLTRPLPALQDWK